MSAVVSLFRNAYAGLSKEAWMLAFVMFINRTGTMVIPFMGLYMTTSLNYSVKQAGIILAIFGLGSMIGSLLGGWLVDRFGQFRVQIASLTIGGTGFILLSQVTEYYSLAICLFITSILAECVRPANATSVTEYSPQEQVTRAFSLNRMAVNLGFTIGPAIAGLLSGISYKWLFVADGLTSISAGLVFYFFFRHRERLKKSQEKKEKKQEGKARLDIRFLVFIILVACFAIAFFQLLSTLSLYYKNVYKMSEQEIGYYLGFNGLVVFLFEMVLVSQLNGRIDLWKLIAGGTLLCGFSLIFLNLFTGTLVLVASMFLLSLSEIFAMPFMATYVTLRSGPETRGKYMGMYSFAYSVAFMLAPYLGTGIISYSGYTALWWSAGALSLLTAAGFFFLLRNASVKPGSANSN
jgi:MFS family permease